MRRFFIGGGLAALLGLGAFFAFSGGISPAVESTGRATRMPRYGGRGWPASTATAASYSFCDNLTAGMRSGAWSCVNGDISSPADGTLAFTGVNSPVATTGTTCAAPNYVTFANGSTDSHVVSTATMATPPGDFTACMLGTPSNAGTTASYVYLGDYGTLTPYAFTQEGAVAYFHGGTEQSASIGGVNQDTKTLFCIKWTSSTKTGSYYVNSGGGSTEVAAPATSTALAATGSLLRFGADSTAYNFDGKFFGGFLTYTKVPQATLDTFFAATVTCP